MKCAYIYTAFPIKHSFLHFGFIRFLSFSISVMTLDQIHATQVPIPHQFAAPVLNLQPALQALQLAQPQEFVSLARRQTDRMVMEQHKGHVQQGTVNQLGLVLKAFFHFNLYIMYMYIEKQGGIQIILKVQTGFAIMQQYYCMLHLFCDCS